MRDGGAMTGCGWHRRVAGVSGDDFRVSADDSVQDRTSLTLRSLPQGTNLHVSNRSLSKIQTDHALAATVVEGVNVVSASEASGVLSRSKGDTIELNGTSSKIPRSCS